MKRLANDVNLTDWNHFSLDQREKLVSEPDLPQDQTALQHVLPIPWRRHHENKLVVQPSTAKRVHTTVRPNKAKSRTGHWPPASAMTCAK